MRARRLFMQIVPRLSKAGDNVPISSKFRFRPSRRQVSRYAVKKRPELRVGCDKKRPNSNFGRPTRKRATKLVHMARLSPPDRRTTLILLTPDGDGVWYGPGAPLGLRLTFSA